ncbi:MAG: hypothetical protein ACYDAR_01640 [Thermomicrobiales bacterium]
MQNLLGFLPFLACPLGMGWMMWLMMRGKRQKPDVTPMHSDNRLQALHSEMDQVQAQIGRLKQDDRGSKQHADAIGSKRHRAAVNTPGVSAERIAWRAER